VLVSEVMLQQTQAARVASAFPAFMSRFPDVCSLAGASRADVLRAWGALGYNRRAVGLHDAAREIIGRHGGRIPRDEASLLSLSGVGPYTAAAVASLAFGEPTAVLDTNARRIVARVGFGAEPEDVSAAQLRSAADAWIDRNDPAGWNSALMNLGREVCRPREPRCDECTLAPGCRFRKAGLRGTTRARRQPPFRGSNRELRGAIVRTLRERVSATPARLAQAAGCTLDRVSEVIDALEREGIVETRRGRVRLPR